MAVLKPVGIQLKASSPPAPFLLLEAGKPSWLPRSCRGQHGEALWKNRGVSECKLRFIKLSWESTERVIFFFLAWPCRFLPGRLLRSVPASSAVTCRLLLAGSLAKQLVCTIALTPPGRVRGDVLGLAMPSG